jgi:hypothetical protein
MDRRLKCYFNNDPPPAPRRNIVAIVSDYLAILNEGTEPNGTNLRDSGTY